MLASFGHVRRQLSTRIMFWNCGQVGERGVVVYSDNPRSSARRKGSDVYSRKKMIPSCAVVTPRLKAAVFKSCALNRTGRGPCGQAFRKALCSHVRCARRVSLV